MSKRASWRGLHELADAKERAKEVELAIENLLKEHKGFSKNEIKNHSDRFCEELEDLIAEIKEKQNEILQDLEEHRKKLLAKERFLRRHYKSH